MAKGKKRSNTKVEQDKYLLGLDLGGTKILAAVVDSDGKIVGEAKKRTQASLGPDKVIDRIVETASEAITDSEVRPKDMLAAGIGAPAPVDVQTGTVFAPPNLPGWDVVPLGDLLEKGLGIPVIVDNDVNLGTFGEHELGAGRGTRHMVGIFVGTGVGGGVIVNGKLHRGIRYSAGEVGHMIMVPDGPLCGCGRRGCLEALASRTAMERDVRAAMAAGRPTVVGDLMAASGRDRLTSGTIKKAVKAGDEVMIEVIGKAQYYLGLLSANLVDFMDPEMLVFGGGVVEALGESFLEPIRTTARSYFLQQRDMDKVKFAPATLGDYAGVLGAAMLAAQMVDGEV
ncbi:MAG: ROK family protein [Chloroflexota bacterium]|nr:ROK family protein [Chloroflexota bacterium]